MTDSVIDVADWRQRLTDLEDAEVSAVVVVQCDQAWLRPSLTAFRNEVDQALIKAQLRRGDRLAITRIILHGLPLASGTVHRPAAVDRAFTEWHDRLSAASILLPNGSSPAHRIHRLILGGDQTRAPIPDMVELLKNGDWTDQHRAELVLRTIEATGTTTPLTGYDVDLDGPFGDADPSVYL
ncbi:hypothetical protein ACWC24_00250 [Streptomyces sp. NPDC001443]